MVFSSPVPYNLSDKPLCFIHIPKTAGSAFKNLMRHFYAPGEACPHIFMQDIINLPPQQLAQYRYFSGHMHYTIRKYLPKDAHFITFLRDPVQRLISQYQYSRHRLNAGYKSPVDIDFSKMTLEEFVHREDLKFYTRNFQTAYIGAELDIPPPYDFRNDVEIDEAILEQVKKI